MTLLAGSLCLSLVACGGGGDDDDDTPAGADAAPPSGTFTHYVNDSIQVPDTAAESTMLGLNIDGDEQGRVDNALGGLLAALGQQGLDVQTSLTASVTAGELVLLHSLQSDELMNDSSAGWQVYIGQGTAAPPTFDGSDMFTIDPSGPTDAKLPGTLTAGQFLGGPGDIAIQLVLAGGAPIRINLIGARLKANVTATGCTGGVLGGAITQAEINATIIPAIAPLVNNSILSTDAVDGALVSCASAACPATSDAGEALACDTDRDLCFSESSGTILTLLDANKDGNVSADEIRENSIVSSLLAPDVDMIDAAGNPGKDGTKDSLSLGIGFSCVNGVFTAAGE